MQSTVSPPPSPPELPEQARPRWPWWYGPLAFLAGAVAGLITSGILWAALGVDDPSDSPWAIVAGTLLLDGSLVGAGAAVRLVRAQAAAVALRAEADALLAAVGWAALGMVTFYVLVAIYSAVLDPHVEQSVAKDLGAEDSSFGLIAAGFMIICVAPFAEEFFFRGFFYGALRTQVHGDRGRADRRRPVRADPLRGRRRTRWLIVPPLAFLGFMFCLVYERTRSLYPVIALHSINNSIAYAAQADGGAVAAVFGPLVAARLHRGSAAAATGAGGGRRELTVSGSLSIWAVCMA